MEPIVNPTRTIEILKKHNIRLTKSLGQHFLVDKNILEKIINMSNLASDDVILEIGAGIGTLTEALIGKVNMVLAVEYDSKFFPILEENFKAAKNFHLIRADALKIVPKNLPLKPNKVVSNLPYNIASPLIMKILEEFIEVKELVVMIQKEVAKRITAKPGTKDYGALTLKINYYAEPELLFEVSKNVFLPLPKVDSAVIRIKRPLSPRVNVDNRKVLFNLISAAFSQRRKIIANTLSSFSVDKCMITKALLEAGIDPRSRGETLSLPDFAKLSNILGKLNFKKSQT
ncbi:16S rRNA (adenine(1518)-N(6)/adenine(1519)-N(6))-dimethyltransferase RsmA [Candidatus Oleimmundimicrobium sp.]|uniref:16S rRNA (adenine(1518)-N(6)/adenine(1519)-N(6))- dimethyltransferase RsmA n=1 Tax=Candidatus Oleimmundimicrobium sp. TaxID=3060597 RepID=UPI0027212062|nr:16S rRNA (adenine(1518)-N(6)/adenine(1519)-N(6))-dimethyltransferase RsmA [Candidatus Oleimmundimicrobium sp.]MDO8886307.1 16S rRNA (adenine(1518)-N(6)/adenine(1519)-N(6))-dimethyltransferase RsmA [Candidatus Oleimmundimicrobium sp.]